MYDTHKWSHKYTTEISAKFKAIEEHIWMIYINAVISVKHTQH